MLVGISRPLDTHIFNDIFLLVPKSHESGPYHVLKSRSPGINHGKRIFQYCFQWMSDVDNGVQAIRAFGKVFRSEEPLCLGAGNTAIDRDKASHTEKVKAVVADEGLGSVLSETFGAL